MRRAPEKIPPDPIPAMTLPMIKARELGAAPQTRLPNWKKARAVRKTYLMGKRLYSLP